jgi:hypothetical protein
MHDMQQHSRAVLRTALAQMMRQTFLMVYDVRSDHSVCVNPVTSSAVRFLEGVEENRKNKIRDAAAKRMIQTRIVCTSLTRAARSCARPRLFFGSRRTRMQIGVAWLSPIRFTLGDATGIWSCSIDDITL